MLPYNEASTVFLECVRSIQTGHPQMFILSVQCNCLNIELKLPFMISLANCKSFEMSSDLTMVEIETTS